MNRLLSLALFAICCFNGLGPSARADDCEEKLKQQIRTWMVLKEEERAEVRPVLRILVCEVMSRPPLNPAKAFEKARAQLHMSIKDLINSVEGQADPNLVSKLNTLLNEVNIASEKLDEPYGVLKKTIQQQSGSSSKLVRYARLARAIEAYKLLFGEKDKTPADYAEFLKCFQAAMIDYISAPDSEGLRENLGKKVALLEAFADADKSANIEDLLIEVRKVCKRPNFWLLVSDKLINDLLNSAVNPISDTQCVAECILDTSISGTAQVSANASVSTNESFDYAALKVNLNGSSTSDTVGYHKPVQIKSVGTTSFSAEKNVCISDAAFSAGRAAASACTDTTICSIDKVGRQCLSNLIERVAWKRACQQKPQAESIASQKFECKLEASFDDRLDTALVKARKFYQDRVITPLSQLGILPISLKFSSTTNSVAVGAALTKPEVLGAPRFPKSQVAGQVQNDLTLKFHDSILMNNSADRIPPEVFDRLINEFLSNLRGVESGSQPEDLNPKILSAFSEVIGQSGNKIVVKSVEDILKNKMSGNRKLEFSGVTYENGWVTLNWRLNK